MRYTDVRGDPLGPWYEIVGVVDDTDLAGTVGIEGIGQVRPEGGLYLPLTNASRSFGLIARLNAPPESFAPRLRALIAEIDPSYIVSDPRPVQIAVADAQLRATAPIQATFLLTAFLVVLAAAGTYALMSFTVSQRRREIGVRTALGAQRHHITGLIAFRSLGQLGIGSLVGAPLAWQVLRGTEISGLGGSHLALAVLLAVGVALVVAMLACTGPVVRALRVTPSETLQSDA
jgi:ABC-type antimicrobial peptide transport system permease subunit